MFRTLIPNGSFFRISLVDWLLCIKFTLAILAIYFMLQPGSYVSNGNLHDTFIPYNSALAMLQGLELHKDFHSAFGWVYFKINSASWRTITNFPSILLASDLIAMSSLIFAAIIFIIHTATHLLSNQKWNERIRVRLFIGIYLALTALNFRGVSGLAYDHITWYGAYNSHLWSLILLQLYWTSEFLSDEQATPRSICLNAAIHAFAVTVSLNYKLSFGIASLIISTIPIIGIGRNIRHQITHILFFSTASVFILWAFQPENYDYLAYIDDLTTAFMAKAQASGHERPAPIWAGLLLFIALSIQENISAATKATTRTIIMPLFVAFSIYFGALGDFAKPWLPFFAGWAIWTLGANKGQKVNSQSAQGSMVVLIMLACANLAQLGYIAYRKPPGHEPKNFVAVQIDSALGPLKWTIPNREGYGLWAQSLGLPSHPEDLMIKAQIAFPESIDKKLESSLKFPQVDYVRMIAAAAQFAADHPQQKHFFLEFSDVFPLLSGSKLPNGSFHWIHFGTSIPFTGLEKAISTLLNQADSIVVPIYNVSYHDQALLNCKFYSWNMSSGQKYRLVSSDLYNLYYVRNNESSDLMSDQLAEEVETRCLHLISDSDHS